MIVARSSPRPLAAWLLHAHAALSEPSAIVAPVAHPVVFISGGEDFLAEREVSRIVGLLRKVDPSLERRDVDGSSESAHFDFADAVAPSLFGETAIVVVDSVEAANDQLQTAIFELIAAGQEEQKVLLVQRGLQKGRGFVDKLKKSEATTLTFEKPKGKDFDAFITNEFKVHKRKVTADALRALRNSVGDDLRALAAAISQLCSDLDSNPLDASDVEQYYEGMAGVATYSISDAVFDGKTVAALTALRWAMEREPNIGPAVVATAANSLRALVAVASAASGTPDAEVARVASVPPWKVRSLRDQVRRWRPTELADAALLLTKADAALKAGEIDALGEITVLDPAQRQAMLERTLLSIARSSGR